MEDWVVANRANWDDRVPIHAVSAFYDVEGWLAERPGPRLWEREALGDVAGLDVVHLQCHLGLDTLALADVGARVTGVDFSREAIEFARRLATRAGLADRARFVEADVLEVGEVLASETFDVVYVSVGSLCWLPNVASWAGQVAALLRPGGRLYLHDGHPLAWALAEDDLQVEQSYFEESEPVAVESDVTYTDGNGRLAHSRNYEWNHSIGEIVEAVINAGLRVDRLVEHDWTVWRRFDWLEATSDGRWVTPPGMTRVPLSFTLLASLVDR